MEHEVITNKQQMYALWNQGRFGNAGLNFPTPEDAFAWGCKHQGLLAIRTKRAGGGPFIANIPAAMLLEEIAKLEAQGYTLNEMQFSAMMPDHRLRMQGYVRRSCSYLDLDYNLTPGRNMRESMQYPQHAEGLRAKMLLEWALEASDYDDLMTLLDTYDDHVIEFTAYECDAGNLPRRNTVIWEVRRY